MTCACGRPIGKTNTTGVCKRCRLIAMNRDPEVIARRTATQRATLAKPEMRQKRSEERAAWHKAAPEEYKTWLRERGKHLQALSAAAGTVYSPEVRARAGAKNSLRRVPWCPLEHRALNRKMKALGYTEEERRGIIEAEVEGTAAHAKRAIANLEDARRIRVEREKAMAY